MKPLSELKQIDKGEICPACGLTFIHHARGSECRHDRSVRHALSDAIQQIEALREFIATILCWKPEWAQTTYFRKLSDGMRGELIELAKSTKYEGSGGIDDEWLDALLVEIWAEDSSDTPVSDIPASP